MANSASGANRAGLLESFGLLPPLTAGRGAEALADLHQRRGFTEPVSGGVRRDRTRIEMLATLEPMRYRHVGPCCTAACPRRPLTTS